MKKILCLVLTGLSLNVIAVMDPKISNCMSQGKSYQECLKEVSKQGKKSKVSKPTQASSSAKRNPLTKVPSQAKPLGTTVTTSQPARAVYY